VIARSGRRLARGVSRGVDAVALPTGITVLTYHQVDGGTDRAVDLPATLFAQQMEHLVEAHRILRLDDAIDELTHGSGPTQPGVVVTVDDGTADVTDTLVPLLVQHGIPATLYLATHFVETGTAFPWGARPTSWWALRDAMTTGLLSIECHTHSHPVMHRLDAATAAAELDRSLGLIEDRLGVQSRHFAYPRAVRPSPAAEAEVRCRFRSAALASSRTNRRGSGDVHRLWRTPVQRDDGDRFATLAAGGGWFDGLVRAGTLSLAHRRAS
jgi:peptidoglycan/xylan/chitin deacetylase (PgdA/CDA1 family)